MIAEDGDEFKVKLETAKEREARLEQIIATWAKDDINQRGLAGAFELRFDGQLWPDEYRFDPHRGRWMEFKAGHWRPARTILNGVGGLIERLCGTTQASHPGGSSLPSTAMFWPWQRKP